MKSLLILAVICVIIPFAFGAEKGSYGKSPYVCSTTDPGTPATGWTYCVEQHIWIKTDCDHLAVMNDDPLHKVQCNNGYAWTWNSGKREVEEISERSTYASCPVTGADKKVCCPSPKTCHTGSTPADVCY